MCIVRQSVTVGDAEITLYYLNKIYWSFFWTIGDANKLTRTGKGPIILKIVIRYVTIFVEEPEVFRLIGGQEINSRNAKKGGQCIGL